MVTNGNLIHYPFTVHLVFIMWILNMCIFCCTCWCLFFTTEPITRAARQTTKCLYGIEIGRSQQAPYIFHTKLFSSSKPHLYYFDFTCSILQQYKVVATLTHCPSQTVYFPSGSSHIWTTCLVWSKTPDAACWERWGDQAFVEQFKGWNRRALLIP